MAYLVNWSLKYNHSIIDYEFQEDTVGHTEKKNLAHQKLSVD